MGDLVVKPSYQLGPRDILTVDKINLMATPVVELALEDPVNDQNYLRNGNFYSAFWVNASGVNAPVDVDTENANFWFVTPQGGAVNYKRANSVPDQFSLFSAELDGTANAADVEFGQQIIADLAATLRRKCTFSGYLYNGTGLTLSSKLNIYTCNSFNNFNDTALQTTVNLQTCPNATWTYATATLDLSTVANVANGTFVAVLLPAGSLNATTKYVQFSRLKLQIGEIATEFVDDTSLFVTTPTIDASMLQDGCIARPSLFQPNVIPSGTYQAKSIKNGDIDDGAIDGRTLAAGAVAGNLGYTPINKAGDTAIGPGALQFSNDDVVGSGAPVGAAIIVNGSTANNANDGYMPAISFNRTGKNSRAVGLESTGKLKTVDQAGNIAYLLDSYFKVDTNSYQDGSITYQKLAQSLINLLVPIATVHLFAGVSPPGGWFVCDGSAVSRTTYAALFAQLGTYWGTGDNITTFNIPNFVNRMPVGFGTGALYGFGTRGGEATHTLNINEVPSHAHSITDQLHGHSDSGHTHSYANPLSAFTAQAGSNQYSTTGAGNTGVGYAAITANYSNINHTEVNGGSGAHNNMPPYGVCYFIIKAI